MKRRRGRIKIIHVYKKSQKSDRVTKNEGHECLNILSFTLMLEELRWCLFFLSVDVRLIHSPCN